MDFGFVFSTLFDINADSENNNNSEFNILKYALPLRKLFYKYYPEMINKNKNLSKIFSLKQLEQAIISDSELIYIPMELIDVNIIQTKTFDKLLSQDYEILDNYVKFITSEELNSEKVDAFNKQIVKKIKYNITYNHINLNALFTNFNNIMVNNLEFYAKVFKTINVVNSFCLALNTLPINFVIEYLNEKLYSETYNNIIESIIIRRFYSINSRLYIDDLWNNVNENGCLNLLRYVINNQRNTVMNKFSHLKCNTEFIDLFKNIDCSNDVQTVLFFENNIINDDYKGEWIYLNPSEDLDYNEHILDGVSYKMDDKEGIRMKFIFKNEKSNGFHIVKCFNKYASSKKCPYEEGNSKDVKFSKEFSNSMILLQEVIKYNTKLLKFFDKNNAEIRKYVIKHCPINDLKHMFYYDLCYEECAMIINEFIEKGCYKEDDSLRIFNLFDITVQYLIIDIAIQNKEFSNVVNKELFGFVHDFKGIINKKVHASKKFIDYLINYDGNICYMRYLECIDFKDVNVESEYTKYEVLDKIIDKDIDFLYDYCEKLINDKQFDSKEFKYLENKYFEGKDARNDNILAELGLLYIKVYMQEPPLRYYPHPNYRSNKLNKNSCSAWGAYVNISTVPKEMSNVEFYNYMIKCNGAKKNGNYTSCYTFFSNSLENKIVFIKSDVILNLPAELRFDVPIEFAKVKKFLHEDIETNNICMFSELKQCDWDKISGGNSLIDCVVISDSKNIYRDRTPLKTVLSYLINCLEIEYDMKVIQ